MSNQFGIAGDRSPEYMNNLIRHALQSLNGVVILDDKGTIVYLNEGYANEMDTTIAEALGKNILEVVPDSVLPAVLQTGQPSAGAIYCRSGRTMLVNRVPIKDGDKVLGVFAESVITRDTESEVIEEKLQKLMREVNYYKAKYKTSSTPRFNMDSIVSKSALIEDMKRSLRDIAQTRSSVLLTGESGTGKEVFAGALHDLSPRRDKPFVKLNCAAIPDTLLESELFGYVGGAFTGAARGGKIGDFEAANGGTIFLDEVDALSPNMQAKLLRAIQMKEIKKLGSTKPVRIDVRFVFATNKDLYALVKEEKFRADFYYRINVVNLHLPPLRERPEDIPPLVESFIRKYNHEMERNVVGVDPLVMLLLRQYSWPGNIRELENCIERAFNYTRGSVIGAEAIQIPGLTETTLQQISQKVPTLRQIRANAERLAILRALEVCGGNKSEAAARLEVDRSVLYQKMKQYQIKL